MNTPRKSFGSANPSVFVTNEPRKELISDSLFCLLSAIAISCVIGISLGQERGHLPLRLFPTGPRRFALGLSIVTLLFVVAAFLMSPNLGELMKTALACFASTVLIVKTYQLPRDERWGAFLKDKVVITAASLALLANILMLLPVS